MSVNSTHWIRQNGGKNNPLQDDNDSESAAFLYDESIVTFYMGCVLHGESSCLLNIYFGGMKDSVLPLILSYTDNALKLCDCCCRSSSLSPILLCCKTAKRYIRKNHRRSSSANETKNLPLDYEQMEVPPSLYVNDKVLLWDEHASVSCCAYYETYTPIVRTVNRYYHSYHHRDKFSSARQPRLSSTSSTSSTSTSWVCDTSPMITWNAVDGPSYVACTSTMLYSTYFQFPLDPQVGPLKDYESIEYRYNPKTNKHSICFWNSNWKYYCGDEEFDDRHYCSDELDDDDCDSNRREAANDMSPISIVHGIGGTIIETRIALQLYKLIKTKTLINKTVHLSNTNRFEQTCREVP